MAAPVDPLAWINENPLLLAVASGVAVVVVTSIPKTTRRFWSWAIRRAGRLARWIGSLRVVPKQRVIPSARQLKRMDVAPVRWVLTVNATATEGTLANTASGTAMRVRVDDGHGTRVFDDATWPEIPGKMEGKFACSIEDNSAFAGTANFRLRWTDARGVPYRQVIAPQYPKSDWY